MESNIQQPRILDPLALEFVECLARFGLGNVTEALVIVLCPDHTDILGIYSGPGDHHRTDSEIESGYRSGRDLTPEIKEALRRCEDPACEPGTIFVDAKATGASYDACIKFKPYATGATQKIPAILFNDPKQSFDEYCQGHKVHRDLIDSLLLLVEHAVRKFIPSGFDISVEVVRK